MPLLFFGPPFIGSQLRRGFFLSSLSRPSKLSIFALLVICVHFFILVSTKIPSPFWFSHYVLGPLCQKKKKKKKTCWRSCLFCGWTSSLEWAAEQCPYSQPHGQVLKTHSNLIFFPYFFQAPCAHCKRRYINLIIIIIIIIFEINWQCIV